MSEQTSFDEHITPSGQTSTLAQRTLWSRRDIRDTLVWAIRPVYSPWNLAIPKPCTTLKAVREQHIALLRQRSAAMAPILPAGAFLGCGAELQCDELCCPSCAQEHRAREEKYVVRTAAIGPEGTSASQGSQGDCLSPQDAYTGG